MSVTDSAPLWVSRTALACSEERTSRRFSLMNSVFTPGLPSVAAW